MNGTFVEVIKACEEAGGSGTKIAIRAALQAADSDAVRLIYEALNPYRVYGIRKFKIPEGSILADDASFEPFYELLDKLANRQLTGNAARSETERVLSLFSPTTVPYLVRVLLKDLKAGFSAETANKTWRQAGVYSEYSEIPSFSVMLAAKCETEDDFADHVVFPCQADHKYDGERTIAFVTENEITFFSRSGKQVEHLDGLFDEELKALRREVDMDYVIDCERYASNFTETQNAKSSGNAAAKANLRLICFYIMPMADWKIQHSSGRMPATMKDNREYFTALLNKVGAKKLVITDGKIVNNLEEMHAYCNEVIDNYGVEGLILKQLDATYIWDRDYAWTKVKRFYDADMLILRTYAGRKGTRLENMMGGIIGVAILETGEIAVACCGGGFSDQLRSLPPEEYIGKVAVIKYQEVSRSKSNKYASLRFLTFEHLRDDKMVEVPEGFDYAAFSKQTKR